MTIKISLTERQAGIILGALRNESNDDDVRAGEYSYWRCYEDVARKLQKAGFESVMAIEDGVIEEE